MSLLHISSVGIVTLACLLLCASFSGVACSCTSTL